MAGFINDHEILAAAVQKQQSVNQQDNGDTETNNPDRAPLWLDMLIPGSRRRVRLLNGLRGTKHSLIFLLDCCRCSGNFFRLPLVLHIAAQENSYHAESNANADKPTPEHPRLLFAWKLQLGHAKGAQGELALRNVTMDDFVELRDVGQLSLTISVSCRGLRAPQNRKPIDVVPIFHKPINFRGRSKNRQFGMTFTQAPITFRIEKNCPMLSTTGVIGGFLLAFIAQLNQFFTAAPQSLNCCNRYGGLLDELYQRQAIPAGYFIDDAKTVFTVGVNLPACFVGCCLKIGEGERFSIRRRLS